MLVSATSGLLDESSCISSKLTSLIARQCYGVQIQTGGPTQPSPARWASYVVRAATRTSCPPNRRDVGKLTALTSTRRFRENASNASTSFEAVAARSLTYSLTWPWAGGAASLGVPATARAVTVARYARLVRHDTTAGVTWPAGGKSRLTGPTSTPCPPVACVHLRVYWR